MRSTTSILFVTILALAAGCASDGYDAATLGADPAITQDPGSSDAESFLYGHDILAARDAYKSSLDARPRSGASAAGYAVTSLLLLPYSSASTKLLTNHLGAQHALNLQGGDVLYEEQGLVYFIARGVSWDDGPSTAGIKTLLADRLPWSRAQLESVEGFVRGLDNPVALMSDDLVDLAEELGAIGGDLGIAIGDENFETYFLPGAVLHDESLDLTLGKAELLLLGGTLAAVEGGLYFFAAYDHAWTLERAFGESIWQSVIDDESDPNHIVGAETIDYQADHINASLGRAVADQELLRRAALATKVSLLAFADALDEGVEERNDTTLDWRNADALVATKLGEFLRALAASVDEPTELPHTEPAQTADLAQLFDGRTVAEGENLLIASTFDDGFGMQSTIEVDPDVLDRLLEGVFDPPMNSESAPVLTIGDDVERLVDTVGGSTADDFERSVGGAF